MGTGKHHGHTWRVGGVGGKVGQSPTYCSWQRMRQRSTATGGEYFKHYGARGIGCCERWADFRNFLEDMGERLTGTTLDRIDNSRGYEPGNCRWVDWHTQANNRRLRVPKSGLRGVFKRGDRWVGRYFLRGVRKYLGTFDTAEEASAAVEAYKP